MANRAEFGTGYKIHFWDNGKFTKACITHLMLNPITKEIEYTVFYRTDGAGNKRRRNSRKVAPQDIRESQYYTGPVAGGQKQKII